MGRGRVQHYDEADDYTEESASDRYSPPKKTERRKGEKHRRPPSSEYSVSPPPKAKQKRKGDHRSKKAAKEKESISPPPAKRKRDSVAAVAEKTEVPSEAVSTVPAVATGSTAPAVNIAALSSSIGADLGNLQASLAGAAVVHPGGFAAGMQMQSLGAQFPADGASSTGTAIATTTMDFSKLKKGPADLAMALPKALVSILMTPENSKLVSEESGATVEWEPGQAKVLLSGSAEQLQRAQRLLNRVMIQAQWGIKEEKVRQCLKPKKLKSVLCRLSPMEHSLPQCEKTLNALHSCINIGKGPENHLILPNPYRVVSRQHCILEFDESRGGVYIHDCSSNGTFLNGLKLPTQEAGKVMLSHGDELMFRDPREGKHEFGYMVNLETIVVETETKLEVPRRLYNNDDLLQATRDRF